MSKNGHDRRDAGQIGTPREVGVCRARRWPTGLKVLAVAGVLLAVVIAMRRIPIGHNGPSTTITTQALLMAAIQAYYDKTGVFPSGGMDALVPQLTRVPRSFELLNNLSVEALAGVRGPVLDGYDRPMRYSPAGGLGGKPLLVSAGADGEFGTEDDVRSDGMRPR